jgi:MFS family permease
MSLLALFLGTAIFVAAGGLVATTVALRATTLGFSPEVTGLVLSAYFVGFVAGTFVGPAIIARTGHVRAFAVFAATASVAVLMHPLLLAPAWWALFRFLTGVGTVGLYMVVESWLNERAANEQRGTVFSIYQGVALTSIGLGQLLLLVNQRDPSTPFIQAGLLFALALIPVCLTRVAEPSPVRPARLYLARLWAISPLAVLGTAIAAIAGSIFFSIGPVYGRYIGMTNAEVALFISVVVFGGALLQWPIGRVSDAIDRRTAILCIAVAGSLLAGAHTFLPDGWRLESYALGFCYGGALFSLYPMCVAHAGDNAPAGELIATASGLLLVYGIGAAAGPLLGGAMIGRFGADAFFGTLGALLCSLALAALVRKLIRPAPPPEAQEPFVALARTSQSALEMLPDATKTSEHG